MVVGITWVVGPLAMLGILLYFLVVRGFDGWPREVPIYLLLLFISACGMYFLLGWPGAKWVLRAIALPVGVYSAYAALVIGGHNPAVSFQWAPAAIPIAGALFAAYSFGVAHRA